MKAEVKDKVTVNYEGKLETGEVFDSSKHGDHSHPLTFTIGNHEVIPGFENGVIGMEKGESKEIKIDKNEAYGDYKAELKQAIPKKEFGDLPIKEGMGLMMKSGEHNIPLRIVKIGENDVEVDLNHPLAGKNLIFNVELVEIEKLS